MPRFFFHVDSAPLPLDEEGVELPDLEAAKAEAAQLIGRDLCDDPKAFCVAAAYHLTIANDDGDAVFTLSLLGKPVKAPAMARLEK